MCESARTWLNRSITSAIARTDGGRLGKSVSRSSRCPGKYCNRRLSNIKPQVHGCTVLKWTFGRGCSWPALRYNPIINSILFHCFREFWIDSRNIKTVIPQLLVPENQAGRKNEIRVSYNFCTVYCNIIIKYKPTKCTFLKLITIF